MCFPKRYLSKCTRVNVFSHHQQSLTPQRLVLKYNVFFVWSRSLSGLWKYVRHAWEQKLVWGGQRAGGISFSRHRLPCVFLIDRLGHIWSKWRAAGREPRGRAGRPPISRKIVFTPLHKAESGGGLRPRHRAAQVSSCGGGLHLCGNPDLLTVWGQSQLRVDT